jgi:hypothetical protein
MDELGREVQFPKGLLDWAGHRAGGVRKLFYEKSGRPSESVIRTRLLQRLEEWTDGLANGNRHVFPHVVLLVGGPGNGKTEAVEFAIRNLDRSLNGDGRLVQSLAEQFVPNDGSPPPRLAFVDASKLTDDRYTLIQIVQDASAGDFTRPSLSPAELLLEELETLLQQGEKCIHLACVNRGVLDDALIIATDGGKRDVQQLLAQVVRSVGADPEPISCWPLEKYSGIAVWPMDIESLLRPHTEADVTTTPAAELLHFATAEDKWPALGECAAGETCPFCLSRHYLSSEPGRSSLLHILRWYELASGKRWSFRDLASLYSFLLAGAPPEGAGHAKYSPCEWAARQQAERTAAGGARVKLLAPYLLLSKFYRHAIFGNWPKVNARNVKSALRELELQDDNVLNGLLHFFNDSRRLAIPPTLRTQLDELCEVLDPALADPDTDVELSSNTTVFYREIDARFSQSVEEGLVFLRNKRCLTVLETDLLKDLDGADKRLAKAGLTRNRPDAARRLQAIVRDFACRIARRSVGCRSAAIRDGATLVSYEKVVAGDEQLLYEAAVQVEELLNKGQRFSVVLNTTFGEPIPGIERRVTLTTDRQRVRVPDEIDAERPASALRFLTVGSSSRRQFIPITYELYRSVLELRLGMLEASLPKAVVALLDITRAKLGGRIVREKDALELGRIQIGLRKDTIVFQRGKFLVKKGSDA